MNYYEVRVAGRSYHSNKPLTYSSKELIEAGKIVRIPVRNKELSGIVLKSVKKPSFPVKPIATIDNSSTPVSEKSLQLLEWLEAYYPTRNSSSLQLFMPSSVLKRQGSRHLDELASTPTKLTQTKHELWDDQAKIVQKVRSDPDHTSILLHGDTGSGKTRVYAELTNESIARGKSVLILTPEIGLTSQLVANIESYTGQECYVLHSQLTVKQRRDLWKAVASSDSPQIVIGTRSALFLPHRNLGLVIVDEAHEDAYKQEQAPSYHGIKTAAKLAQIHAAKLVLGSATPSVVDYFQFQQKNLPILRMKKTESTALSTSIVDLKDRSQFGSSPLLSTELINQIKAALTRKQQSLVFLNRRGTSKLILCQTCGWEDVCMKCDIPMTFHDDEHKMRCHTCNASHAVKVSCPICKSADIVYKQPGTKSLISHIQKLFPDASVARFDTDLKKDERLEARYADVRSGKIDILVGTQLLSKGLDLPKLSVIGVVQADSSLAIPDFSAREKTYQLLHQIIGRVARGHIDGSVVIQTFNPTSQLIDAAVKKDYHAFLDAELDEREKFLYPPFCFMMQIKSSQTSSSKAQEAIQNALHVIKNTSNIRVTCVGPSPSFKQKSHGKFHWQLTVKSKNRSDLTG